VAFDWTTSDERLHAACVAAIGRFAVEHPGEAVCFFALYAAPLDGEAWLALDTLANSVRVAKERETKIVAGRATELRGADAWKQAKGRLEQPMLYPFNMDRASFAHPHLAGVRFPEWDTRPELNDWEYLSSNAWLVVWRVAERLVAERAFQSLTLAAPFIIGCGIDDDEDGFREGVIRLLNWPAGAEPAAAPDRPRD
jgi:hypothetical protein